MHAGIGKIAVHAVNLRQICAAAFRADIHFQLLIATVVAVGEREVDALIKPHLHGAADERADGFFVVADRIADILNLAAVGEIPEAGFAVLLLNRRDVLGYMAVEGIGYIRTVRHVFNDAVQVAELLNLQAAETFGGRSVNGIEIAVFFFELDRKSVV